VSASHRSVLALALVIVVAGLVGIGVHHPHTSRVGAGSSGRSEPGGSPSTSLGASGPTSTSTTSTSLPSGTLPGDGGGSSGGGSGGSGSGSTQTVPPTQPGNSSTDLAANLLTPTDMGGYFHPVLSAATALLDTAPCLAGLAASPAQSGQAVTGLLGPDEASLPEIVEVVASYPGSKATAVFDALQATMRACHTFTGVLAASQVQVPMAAASIPPLADGSSAFQGQFNQTGRKELLGVGLAVSGQDVFCLVYLDVQPPANPIFGGLDATLSAAIGKEA
jgi:hypothetical protein